MRGFALVAMSCLGAACSSTVIEEDETGGGGGTSSSSSAGGGEAFRPRYCEELIEYAHSLGCTLDGCPYDPLNPACVEEHLALWACLASVIGPDQCWDHDIIHCGEESDAVNDCHVANWPED